MRSDCAGNTGGVLLLPVVVTTTTNRFDALIAGEPLSVATVTKVFVLGLCDWLGVQVMVPDELITAPDGAVCKL